MKSATRQLVIVISLLAMTSVKVMSGPGGWDRTYEPTVSGAVYAAIVQSDGKLVFGGAFTSVNGSSARARLARLYSDGSLDTTFFNSGAGVSSIVWALTVQPDGRIVLGGDFTSINGTARTRVARLNANGTVDGGFVPTNKITGSVLAVAVQTNNAVVIGGLFSTTGFPMYNARLNADGATDTSFSSYPNGAVHAIAIQPDGKIVIGGAFTTVNGASRNRIARLNADGSLDNAFQNGLTGASATVRCLQIQSDGKILIGGDFTTVNSTTRGYVARLNSNGSLDTGFNTSSGANGAIYALAVQPDNTVLIGGNFTTYASAALSRIARLYADGTRDTAYTNFGINNTVQALAVQSDGAALIGGTFTTINNTNWSYLGKLYGNLYPPEFVVQPVSRNTNAGANVTFSAQVNNPTSTSFQWRKDGNNILGATGTSYTLFNVQLSDAGIYSVFANNAVGGITSSNAVLNVGTPMTITGQPASLIVTQGQSATFSVTATGSSPSYYRRKNGTFIPGQTNNTLIFASTVPTNAATYSCLVSNFFGSVTSANATLTIQYPPAISVQPVSQNLSVGSNFTVSVTASGVPALAYQWRTNGIPIPGANAADYSVTEAQAYHSADYDVVITNALGSITSSVANITVVYVPPTLSQQPADGNIPVGDPFVLTATGSGTAPLDWQWYQDGVALTNGVASTTNLTGDTTFGYTNSASKLPDAGDYWVVVNNSAGSVTSSVARVNVGYAPVVTQQPVSQTNVLGGSLTLSCTVTGTAPISLQWLFYGSPLPGATNTTLTLTNLQPANIGYYRLAANNAFGSATGSNVTLTLTGYDFGLWNGLVAYYPFNGNAVDESGNGNDGITSGPILSSDRFGVSNGSYRFSALADRITTASANGFPVSTNDFSLVLWVNVSSNSGTHQIFVCNQSPEQFQLHIGPPANDFADIGFQMGGTGAAGTGFVPWSLNRWYFLSVTSTQNVVTIYRDGVMLIQTTTTLGNNAPAGQRNLTFGYRSSPQNQFYGMLDDVRIYNRALSPSEVAQLYVVEADVPVITQQPVSQVVNPGGSAIFTVAATANHPLTYQWQKNGSPISGATNSSLSFSSVQSSDVGFYSVTVSNAVIGVASASVLLNLTGYTDPTWIGLVAYYPFNGNASDESGNGLNGTTNDGTHWAANRLGLPNSALALNGSSGFVSVNDAGGLLNFDVRSDNYAIAAWVMLNDISTDQCLLIDRGTLLNQATSYTVSFQASDKRFTAGAWDGWRGMQACNTSPITIGRWYHLVSVLSNGVLRVFLDGLDETITTQNSGTAAGFDSTRNSEGIRNFGRQSGPSYYRYLNGFLDDIRIYNRALSSDEVTHLYQMESQTTLLPPQSLAAASVGGALELNFTGIPGRSYILQSATNLALPVPWQPVLTNPADANGLWQFTDTNLDSKQKFYRVTTP